MRGFARWKSSGVEAACRLDTRNEASRKPMSETTSHLPTSRACPDAAHIIKGGFVGSVAVRSAATNTLKKEGRAVTAKPSDLLTLKTSNFMKKFYLCLSLSQMMSQKPTSSPARMSHGHHVTSGGFMMPTLSRA